jgi:hypothetical protein
MGVDGMLESKSRHFKKSYSCDGSAGGRRWTVNNYNMCKYSANFF